MKNVADVPAYANVRRSLEAELRTRQAEYRDSEQLALAFVEADLGPS